MDILDPKATEALIKAEALEHMMQSKGWEIMRTILEERVKQMESVKGVKSLKELYGRQDAVLTLERFLKDLDGIAESCKMAKDRMQEGKAAEETLIFKSYDE